MIESFMLGIAIGLIITSAAFKTYLVIREHNKPVEHKKLFKVLDEDDLPIEIFENYYTYEQHNGYLDRAWVNDNTLHFNRTYKRKVKYVFE